MSVPSAFAVPAVIETLPVRAVAGLPLIFRSAKGEVIPMPSLPPVMYEAPLVVDCTRPVSVSEAVLLLLKVDQSVEVRNPFSEDEAARAFA